MKLLVCDDDISTVDVIQSQLLGEELGITVFLRAYNGEVAKEIIAQEKPELILCDIGMPKCNGIQVLQYIYENGIETEFAFLTCYEDFEYAKTALQYGASNYITKPFEMDELRMALQRMAASVRQKNNSSQAQQDSVLNSVLRQISDGMYGSDRKTINSLLQRNSINYNAETRWHMVVSCADMTDAIREIWSQELLMYTIGRLHDETLVEYIGSAYTLLHVDERFLWCTCFVPESACSRVILEERCRRLLALCENHTSLSPVFLISELFPLYEAGAVKSQMHARMRKIRLYAGKIFGIQDADEESRSVPNFLDTSRIHWYLKRHDTLGFQEYIRAVTDRLAASRDYTRQVMDHLRREIIYAFSTCIRDNGITESAIFSDSKVSALEKAAVQSVDDMCRYALVLFENVDARMKELADSDDIITRVEAYIQAHFRENINRDDVAAIAYITPNYLSKQFRNKKGMNLREYINQIRIGEAKRLLLTTNLSVSEVAGLSGYENISYFSTVFRKHTGMSPIDWRNLEIANGEKI